MESAVANVTKQTNPLLLGFVTPLSLLIEKDWARQFLLHSTPESGLSLLTSKTHQKYGIVGELRNQAAGTGEDENFLQAPQLASFFNANWAVIPAFNVDRYSALIFIKEETNPWNKSIFGQRFPATLSSIGPNKLVRLLVRRRQFRHELTFPCPFFPQVQVIVDNETGTVVGVFSDEHFFYVMVLRRKLNVRGRHRGFFRVAKDVLLANNLPSILAHIPMLIHTSEVFLCAQCPPEFCLCPPPPMLFPKYALDLTAAGINMNRQVGTYTGHLETSKFGNSSLFSEFSRPTPIVGEIAGGNKPGTLPRLLLWAITHLLSRALANSSPAKSPLPLDVAIAAQVAIGEQLKLLSSEQQHGSTHVTDNTMITLPTSSGSDQTSLPLPCTSSGLTHFNEKFMNEAKLDQALGIVSGNLTSDTISATQAMPQGEPTIMSEFNRILDIAPPTNSQLNLPPSTAAIQPYPIIQPARKPPPIPEDDSAEAKALRRKLRNRESAARSNLKKQLRTAELKRQISEARLKQSTLEDRLKQLQAENCELKQRVWN